MIGFFGPRVPLVRRMVARDAARFAITIAGVAMSVELMLFLLALYDGVRTEANGWVGSRPVDAWVAQANTTNFIKASSFMPEAFGDVLREEPGVGEATPLLRLITLLRSESRTVTTIVVGIEAASDAGRPHVVEGTDALEPGGIIVDWALSRRLRAGVGDELAIEGHAFRIVGLSRGTNSVLTQYAFITIEDARALFGIPGVASYFLVRAAPGTEPAGLIARLRERLPRASVLAQATFAENNMDEMRGGLIPILLTVAVLGGIVAFVVLTLLLYGSVLERREDYALLKAIGASSAYVARIVLGQALLAVSAGIVLAGLLHLVAEPLAARFAPTVPLALSPRLVVIVAASALLVGALGALLPLQRITRIHPAEVFRA